MSLRVALLLLFAVSTFASTPPCDRVELWRQIAPLRKLSQNALIARASEGDAFAQFFLAGLYLDSSPGYKDESLGVSWLQQAAANGLSRAQLFLGQVYETGKLIPHDSAAALTWYNKAAEQGDCEAELFLGMHYLGSHFDAEANSWNYKDKKDTPTASFWLQRAAEHGQPDAQAELGRLYERGEGVGQDYVAAIFWYRKAADHGPDLGGAGQGRNQLGLLYLEGRGVQKDYIEAYKWFALAGHKVENQVASRMSRSEVKEARRRVEVWKQQHAAEIMEARRVFAGTNSN